MNLKVSLKKIIVPLFLSVLCGFLCGKLVFQIYDDKTNDLLTDNLIYLIQTGAYSSYDNMRINTVGHDYVYYQDDGLYKAIIGITKDKNNIEKITGTYNEEVVVNSYYLYDEELTNKIVKYDSKLKNTKNEEIIKEIVIDMLNIYKEKEDIKIIKKDL